VGARKAKGADAEKPEGRRPLNQGVGARKTGG